MAAWLFLVYNVFLVVSAVLYLTVWLCLIKRRNQLNSAFYRICILMGLTDLPRLVYIILLENLLTAMNWTLVVHSHALLNKLHAAVSFFFNVYCFYVNLLGLFLMTANRYTAIVKPVKHAKVWAPARCHRYFALTIAVPLLLPALFWLQGCEFGYGRNDTLLVHLFADKTCFTQLLLINWVFQLFPTLPLLIGLHCRMIVELRRRFKTAANPGLLKAEAHLMLVGLALALIFAAMQLLIVGYVIPPVNRWFVSHIHDWFWWGATRVCLDATVLANVYLLLGCSRELRQHVASFVGWSSSATDVSQVTPAILPPYLNPQKPYKVSPMIEEPKDVKLFTVRDSLKKTTAEK